MTNDLHKDIVEKLKASFDAGISDETMDGARKKLKSLVDDFESDLEYRIKDDLAANLVSFVETMAQRTVESILEGNEEQMRRFLGCEGGHWTGRSNAQGGWRDRPDHEFHSIHSGDLFEQGALKLRHQIVDAFPDLLRNERILDLEDQVKCLTAMCNKLKADFLAHKVFT